MATPKQIQKVESVEHQVDAFLDMRKYVEKSIRDILKENQDFYEIKGKKSLAKGGAEKLATIFGFTAMFEVDKDVMALMPERKDWVAFVCNLLKNGKKVGQGRGASTLLKNQNDPNKMLKMAQKSAFIDAVIRTTGLSDIFTQDLEDMPTDSVAPAKVVTVQPIAPKEETEQPEASIAAASQQQMAMIKELAAKKNVTSINEALHKDYDPANLTQQDANDIIKGLLAL